MNAWKNRPLAARVRCALQGVAHALRAERSLRIQAAVLLAVLALLLVLHPGALWWAAVLIAGAVVMAAELLNTAIEQLADRLHPDTDPAIRTVKDCAAGAVLVAALGALGVAAALALHLLTE
jgi:diacylglycerol kinase (ATP)